jgi:dihydrofolate reductase
MFQNNYSNNNNNNNNDNNEEEAATVTISKSFRIYLNNIAEKHDKKITIMGSAHIILKALR